MQDQVIGLGEEPVQRDQGHRTARGIGEGVVADDLHAQGPRLGGEDLPDAPEADPALPAARDDGAVTRHDMAREGEDLPDGKLRHRQRIGAGRHGDGNAPRRAGRDVDGVQPRAMLDDGP